MMFMLCVALQVVHGCLPKEREALLQFKAAIVARYNMLSSWSTPDCCQWQGIRCSNLTAHILGLHLPGDFHLEYDYEIPRRYISGEIYNSLTELRQLEYLNLSLNSFPDTHIPEFFGSLTNLRYLDLSSCDFSGGIPKSFGNACALRSLDMSRNSLSEEFPRIIHHLSGCARYSLEKLDLNMNQINGTLPDFSTFTSLRELNLCENKLNGEIPKDIQFSPKLQKLYMNSNSLKGVLTDYHFSNMSKLRELDLSDNSLALTFTQNWVSPFQLFQIKLRSCELGPTFPKWLLTQNNFGYIDISNASISDIVPEWFWAKLALLEERMSMNISYNHLRGIIPNFPPKNRFFEMSLGSNQFEGHIPLFLRKSAILDLSKNKFSDSTLFLCWNGTFEALHQLDLSNNQLSGQISDCWTYFKSLTYFDLSHNKFSGKIPSSMGSLFNLQALLLRNNLKNEIPFSLRSCTELVMLDMAENKLTGPFPVWIGSNLKRLQFLSLGSNNFYGNLPTQICYLRNIQLLDLSLNNLFGQIPKCIKNFVAMAQKGSEGYAHDYKMAYFATILYELNDFLMWKGLKQMFTNNQLILLKSKQSLLRRNSSRNRKFA